MLVMQVRKWHADDAENGGKWRIITDLTCADPHFSVSSVCYFSKCLNAAGRKSQMSPAIIPVSPSDSFARSPAKP